MVGEKNPVVSLCTYSFKKLWFKSISNGGSKIENKNKIIWTTAWQMHFNLKTLTRIPISAIQDFDTNLKSIKRRRTRLSLNIFLKPNQIYKAWWSIQHIHSSSRRKSPTCKTRIVNEKNQMSKSVQYLLKHAITFPVGLEKLVCKYLPWFMVSIVMFHRRSPKSKVQKKFYKYLWHPYFQISTP